MSVSDAYTILFSVVLVVIGLCLCAIVVKSVIGPRISDRLMTINMIGTLVTSAIAVLSIFLSGEAYLVDICIIYVLISFLSVVVFTNVFINEYISGKKDADGKNDDISDAEGKR